jgi:hypothetical protein
MQTESPKAEPPKRKRRRVQFRLRTLFVFTTILVCGLAWLGWKVREARQQQTAVAAIRRLGGFVT